MNSKKFALLSGFIILIMITALAAFAQEPAAAPADQAAVPAEQQEGSKSENDTQWAWGEVTSLDAPAKTLTLKYLDYETDQEKDLVLTVDEKTVFENIKSLDEIKVNDTLSIDYTVGADGKNTAKNINFEKPDSSPAAPVSAAGVQPAEAQAGGSSVPANAPASAEAAAPAAQEVVQAQ